MFRKTVHTCGSSEEDRVDFIDANNYNDLVNATAAQTDSTNKMAINPTKVTKPCTHRLTLKKAIELVDARRHAAVDRLLSKVDDETTQHGRVDLPESILNHDGR